MESAVDQRGRVLIPQQIRERLGFVGGRVVKLEQRGKAVVITPTEKRRRRWGKLRGIRPARTGKPKWSTPEEIKGIQE